MDTKALKIKDVVIVIALAAIAGPVFLFSSFTGITENIANQPVAYIATTTIDDKSEKASMSFDRTSLTPLSIPTFSFSSYGAVSQEMYVPVSAYNSEIAQTDATPFITANGDHVFDGGVAANFLPFGTQIKMPDHFGDKVFVVNDRMHKKYDKKVDIWMAQKPDAIQWGVRNVRIQILES